ncbi:MAG: DUF523 and DUF1722 domain-containing protein [Desulfuromonadaceae bacterium]|nr:DUF523 and DUF1722 domain-containing protein [Desulfuromonadaceae bacterium]
MRTKIRLGISSCLLGHKVRFDGGHKMNRYLHDTLAPYVEYVPVCPEKEIGLSIPRPALRQVDAGDGTVRLVFSKTGEDITTRMQEWAQRRVLELEEEDLDGFVFKANSPSSGMERVRVYMGEGGKGEKGMPRKDGIGLFAAAFMQHFPLLPVEEEGRLNDAALRENFITRIFTLQRFRHMLQNNPTYGDIVEFHTRHKLLLMAHSVESYREIGRLVAQGKELSFADFLHAYRTQLLKGLSRKATLSKHTNVLHHILGYFKHDLNADEKQEVVELIDSYCLGLVPLIVPVTLLNHFVRKFKQAYLQEQVYLNPHPKELKLLNHV